MADGTSFNPNLPKRWSPDALANTNITNEIRDYLASQGSPHLLGDHRPGLVSAPSYEGIVWDAGPAGEADKTTELYWIKGQIVQSGSGTAAASLSSFNGPAHDIIILATNLDERKAGGAAGSGTHALPKNTPVRVFVEHSEDGIAHYIFHRPPSRLIPVSLAVDGGVDGTTTAAANFTYTATDQDAGSVTYGTHFTYAQRPKGKILSASHGILRVKPDGSYELVWCDEVPNYTKYGVATDVTCNGDGTITVTKTDILSPT